MLPEVLPKDIIEKYQDVLPVPVIDIAQDLGLRMYTTPDFDDAQSGSITNVDGEFTIYVNRDHNKERKRFTIGHEIGHFLLHKDKLMPNTEHVDTVKQPLVEQTLFRHKHAHQTLSDEEIQMEIEANRFAADILMPEEEFIAAFERLDSIEEVAKLFGVSDVAATIRANNVLGCAMF